MNTFYLGLGIFVLTFIGIAWDKIPRAVVAMGGASLMLLLKIVHQEEAFHAIDLNVIFLLAGMMIIVHMLAESGLFQWLAIKTVRGLKGEPLPILLVLSFLTAVVSAVLDNVTTVLLMAPVVIVLVQYLELDPVPFLIMQVLASNIGGAATLIGDPPNILIGSSASLGFNTFLIHLGPVVAVVLASFLFMVFVLFRKKFSVTNEVKARVMEIDPSEAITNMPLLIKSLVVLTLVVIGFVLHEPWGFEAATIALGGATLLMIVTKSDPDEVFKVVEWPTLFFYIGLFVMVEGLVEIGLIQMAADKVFHMTDGHPGAATLLVLWFSGLTCSFLNNVPFVATLIPIVKVMAPDMAAHAGMSAEQILRPLWWALALGACLGGNGSIIGSSANFIVVGIAKRSGYEISFWRFFKYGILTVIGSLAISTIYIYLRYLLP